MLKFHIPATYRRRSAVALSCFEDKLDDADRVGDDDAQDEDDENAPDVR